jgi:hypothetical protein
MPSAVSLASGQPLIDLADRLDPFMPLAVLEQKDVVERPMEVIGNIGYLLIKRI